MQQDQLVVGPMTEAELRRVITGPAGTSGLSIEPGLTDTILADLRSADGEPAIGVLPPLSQAMVLTWEQREGDRLTRGGYEGAGERVGVARAIEVSAEAAYGGITDDQKTIARGIFRRMTALGPDRRAIRRPVTAADLRTGHRGGRRLRPDLGRGLPGQPSAGRLRHRGRIAYPPAVGRLRWEPAIPAGLPPELSRGRGDPSDRIAVRIVSTA